MEKWVVFGSGNYLSDIFDLIHTNHGMVKAVINNVTKTPHELRTLHRRLKLVDYEIPLIDIHHFKPAINEKYTIGFMRDRQHLIAEIRHNLGLNFSSLIHSSCILGSNVKVAEGAIIGPGVVIAPNTSIGTFSIINRSVSIGHDSQIGDFCTVSPGVNIGGKTIIGDKVTIGIGAVVIDNITIGSDTVIGAGSLVVKDIPASVMAFGAPAEIVRELEV
jgi:sugar O-acyltransferase (sialic acid O-acetyltransferase NeuD family)